MHKSNLMASSPLKKTLAKYQCNLSSTENINKKPKVKEILLYVKKLRSALQLRARNASIRGLLYLF